MDDFLSGCHILKWVNKNKGECAKWKKKDPKWQFMLIFLTYKAMVIVFLLLQLFLYEIHYILDKMKIICTL